MPMSCRNYHAGIATRTLAQSALAFPCFDMHADVITAALLIGVCMDEHLDLSKVKLNSEAATQDGYIIFCL